ncbi:MULTISPECIES: hypothetical protein [unclassified Sphingomonas]|uniref:hypothetical protein n=1 Tax=unclassified Sphingomonas TaxID=196159 RepID=UPI00286182B4|nr:MULTISPECIES: hypothetical protein [unclassified Sphingomonas]MDR6115464.1 putative membrane protein [Sphingomonas sp. SORGH_AS_0789]MDR6150865.1 putative membrane protein [Sphingomonas sp. SORGH_AS_0742]
MNRFRPILIAIGVMLTLTGLLWIGQGLGYIHWPEQSFMLGQGQWADRGAFVAVVGLLMILIARRLPRLRR